MRTTYALLVVVCAALATATAAAQETRSEPQLIAVLESDAGWEAKYQACEELRRVGTAESVPALAELLTDDKLSHMARFALEPMDNDAAGDALIDALPRTEGLLKIGVIHSLGAREETEAVPALTPLLAHDDLEIADAAAASLGRIGTRQAAEALLEHWEESDENDRRAAVEEALLAAAYSLVDKDRSKEAGTIFVALHENSTRSYVRMGAFRGKVAANAKEAPDIVIAALKGDNPAMRKLAAQLVAETSGEKATRAYAKALPDLEPETQAALLGALAKRGDAAAYDAVINAMDSANPKVQAAAIGALASLGTVDDVDRLIPLLTADNDTLARAAQDALAELPGDHVDAAIVARAKDAPPPLRVQLTGLLANRLADQAPAVAITNLEHDDQSVRMAGLDVLSHMAGPDAIAPLVDVIKDSPTERERSAAAQTLRLLAAREGESVVPRIVAETNDAKPEARAATFAALSAAGGGEALDVIVEALDAPSAVAADEAATVLADWPTPDAAPHLLTIARQPDARHQELALRGYARLAREEPSMEKRADMLKEAMNLAQRPEAKWAVLSAWGTVHTQEALAFLTPLLANPDIAKEAAVAIIAIAPEVAKQDESGKQAALDALDDVLAALDSESIRQRAQRARDEIAG